MRDTGAITDAQYRKAVATKIKLKPGSLYTKIKEPFFFSFVRDQLIAEYGANFVRSGGLRIYTTIDRRLQRLAEQAIREHAERADRSGVRDRCHQPAQRRDPRDGVGAAGHAEDAVQPRRPGPPPGRVVVQDVRPHRGDPAWHQP